MSVSNKEIMSTLGLVFQGSSVMPYYFFAFVNAAVAIQAFNDKPYAFKQTLEATLNTGSINTVGSLFTLGAMICFRTAISNGYKFYIRSKTLKPWGSE